MKLTRTFPPVDYVGLFVATSASTGASHLAALGYLSLFYPSFSCIELPEFYGGAFITVQNYISLKRYVNVTHRLLCDGVKCRMSPSRGKDNDLRRNQK